MRTSLCGITLGALVLQIAGCSHSGASRGLPRDTSGRTVLTFWNGFTGPDGKTMERIVRRFEKENPDVAVRMQIIPWGTYYDKLTLALAYGGAPNVFVLHADRIPEFASFGTLLTLDHVSPRYPSAMFARVPWHASFYRGNQVALPLDVHPIGLYYNTKLFREAGIVDARGVAKPPVKWDEFLEDARKLTRNPGDPVHGQWGFTFTWQRTNWMTFSGQFGGSILTPDQKRCVMNSPANLEATRRMKDLIYRYHVAPPPDVTDAWLPFRQGRVGMAMEGIYQLSSLQEQKGLEYAGAPVPEFGPKRAAWADSHMLCQPAGASPEQSRTAWKFIRFISDHSLLWAEGGQVPARSDIERSAGFRALPVQSQFARELPYVQYGPLSPRDSAIYPLVDPAIQSALLNLQPASTALNDATRRVNQVLKRP